MFNDRVRSFDEAVQHEDLKYTFIKDGSRSVSYHSMLMRYGGNRYATYLDLFDTGWEDRYIPTGTCRPFERKLFLTVRGKNSSMRKDWTRTCYWISEGWKTEFGLCSCS